MPRKEYLSEDGLKILDYLGLKISEQERAVFGKKWDEVYGGQNKDLIRTIRALYSEALPSICGDGDRTSFLVAHGRDSDFETRLRITGLDQELKDTPLEDILKKGPHRFVKEEQFKILHQEK